MPQRTLGNLLKKRRQQLSLTRQALADRLGVNPGHVGYLEAGQRKPSLALLERLADTLDLHGPRLFLLAYPEAQSLLKSRDNRKPQRSAWQRLAGNRALRAKERISPAELKVLKEISRLGRVSSERRLLLVLRAIRLAFEGDWKQW
jgi:transcriptional regulator with XRE-family HTH domain